MYEVPPLENVIMIQPTFSKLKEKFRNKVDF